MPHLPNSGADWLAVAVDCAVCKVLQQSGSSGGSPIGAVREYIADWLQKQGPSGSVAEGFSGE